MAAPLVPNDTCFALFAITSGWQACRALIVSSVAWWLSADLAVSCSTSSQKSRITWGTMPSRLIVAFLVLVTWNQGASGTTAVAKDVPETCPVTRASDYPFVPPAPYPEKAFQGSFWFGTDELWTNLRENGTWRVMPRVFRQRVFWWRQGLREQSNHKLTVTGRRLDAPAPTLSADVHVGGGSTAAGQPFLETRITLPTLGCWEITGHYESHDLAFVVWVTTLAFRPKVPFHN